MERPVGSMETSYRDTTCGELSREDVGRDVRLCGWVCRRRDHGGLIFVDLRDRYGVTQVVIDPSSILDERGTARTVRLEYVIQVEGIVEPRPEGMVNRSLDTGEIEVKCARLLLLAKSNPMPFQIEGPIEASEDIRLSYRYLDLRRSELRRNLELRSQLMRITRDLMLSKGFLDIETPILTRRTPEGARDYLVPSRVHPGKFYALPQSPQLYKQLLMFGGLDRYFQIARCFRDEDLRADRQPEFTQLDVEMSFVDEEDIIVIIEELFFELFSHILGVDIERPFPRMPYSVAMERFGSDRPDLRFKMEIVDFSECFAETGFKIFRTTLESGGRIRGLLVKGGAGFSRNDLKELEREARKGGALGLIWMKFRGQAWSSSIGSHVADKELELVMVRGKVEDGDLVLLVAGPDSVTSSALDLLRREIGRQDELSHGDSFRFVWVMEPPLFEKREEDGSLGAVHHPFTSPVADDVDDMEESPLSVRSRAYDIVLNGVELGGGSIRINERKVQERVFQILGMNVDEYQDKFGFLLEALEYGAPPHGGIALGMDRIAMLLAGAGSLREIIAFPKTTAAQGLMESSPSVVSEMQLKELHIRSLDKQEDS